MSTATMSTVTIHTRTPRTVSAQPVLAAHSVPLAAASRFDKAMLRVARSLEGLVIRGIERRSLAAHSAAYVADDARRTAAALAHMGLLPR